MLHSIDLTSAARSPIYILVAERTLADALAYAALSGRILDEPPTQRSADEETPGPANDAASTVRPCAVRPQHLRTTLPAPPSSSTLMLPCSPTLPAVAER